MKESASKEKIFKKIRDALIERDDSHFIPDKLDFESAIFSEPSEGLDITFAQNFIATEGIFIYCENDKDFIDNFSRLKQQNNWHPIFCVEELLKKLFTLYHLKFETNLNKIDDKSSVGVTTCEYLIARTGSIIVSTGHLLSRRIFIFPPIHIVVAYTSQLVYDMEEALVGLKNKYKDNLPSLITTITGPSRTADIEKTIVMGAHGPKELYLFLIEGSKYTML